MKVYYDKDADLSVIKGKKIAIIGLGGVFRTDSVFFSAVRESFKRANASIAVEYGNHEVKGKEILSQRGSKPQ